MRTLDELISIIRSDNPTRFYKLKEWLRVRLVALSRDHYECQRCNGRWKSDIPIKNIRLTKAKYVHHIKALLDYPELCITMSNLVSLCFSCHEIVEQRNLNKEKKEPLTEEMW